jgi:hypothetical protein
MPETVSGSDPPPQESRVGDDAICFRCDWTGETDSNGCPRCEAPLYRFRGSTEPVEVAPSSGPSPAGDPASKSPVEAAQEEDNAAPAVLGAVSRRTWVIVGALTVAAFWIVTTGGPFDRLRAQNVPPTPNPQSAAPTASSQKDPADTSAGGPIDLSGLDLSGVNGDVTSAPARSPDGSRIVFGARGGTIYSVIVQSGERSVLVHLPGRDLDSVDEIEWSPDGAHIAIMNDLEPGGGRLYVMDADGSGVRVLLHNYEPMRRFAWSPNGESIAYATHGPAGLGWYAVDADGAGPPREIDEPTYLGWRHPGVPTHFA